MNTQLQEVQVASFRLGMDLYAVDIMRIREIIRPQKLSRLPKAPAFVDGVINLRGLVIPVIDMRKRFDLPCLDYTSLTRLLIVRVSGQNLGLVVDDVTEVDTVPVKDIKPPPHLDNKADTSCLLGVCLIKGEMVLLLNLDQILTASEKNELGNLTQ